VRDSLLTERLIAGTLRGREDRLFVSRTTDLSPPADGLESMHNTKVNQAHRKGTYHAVTVRMRFQVQAEQCLYRTPLISVGAGEPSTVMFSIRATCSIRATPSGQGQSNTAFLGGSDREL
jgi:hypothetical protein